MWEFPSVNARQLNNGVKNNNQPRSSPSCYVFIHLRALLCITLHNISGDFRAFYLAPNRIPFTEPKCEHFILFSGIYFIHLFSRSGRNFTVSGCDLPCDVRPPTASSCLQKSSIQKQVLICVCRCIGILSSTFSSVFYMNPRD